MLTGGCLRGQAKVQLGADAKPSISCDKQVIGTFRSRISNSPVRWRCLGRWNRHARRCTRDLRSIRVSLSVATVPTNQAIIRCTLLGGSALLRACVWLACQRSDTAQRRRRETLDRKRLRKPAGGLSCERAGELRSDTSRIGTQGYAY
jgi:hypothetical protein